MYPVTVAYLLVQVEGKYIFYIQIWGRTHPLFMFFFFSGLFLRPDLARLTSQLLLEYVDTPPDIIIQKCLMGQLPECAHCADTLVTSKTLLMYHIGYNTSTSDDRVYKKDEFQCGWRHPFVSYTYKEKEFQYISKLFYFIRMVIQV